MFIKVGDKTEVKDIRHKEVSAAPQPHGTGKGGGGGRT